MPLNAFLSNGVDSSLITAIAQSQNSDPMRTFNIDFPIADFDETAYTTQVAEHLGTKHQQFKMMPNGIEIIEKLI